MNSNLKKLDQHQLNQISSFTQQMKVIKHFKQIYNESETSQSGADRSKDQSSAQQIKVAQLPPEKKAFLKSIPNLHIEQMGFGDLQVDDKDEDFLS